MIHRSKGLSIAHPPKVSNPKSDHFSMFGEQITSGNYEKTEMKKVGLLLILGICDGKWSTMAQNDRKSV
jgi:hypothetical protein